VDCTTPRPLTLVTCTPLQEFGRPAIPGQGRPVNIGIHASKYISGRKNPLGQAVGPALDRSSNLIKTLIDADQVTPHVKVRPTMGRIHHWLIRARASLLGQWGRRPARAGHRSRWMRLPDRIPRRRRAGRLPCASLPAPASPETRISPKVNDRSSSSIRERLSSFRRPGRKLDRSGDRS